MLLDTFRTRYMYFDSYAYKKRSGNTFTVIDFWSNIKKNIGKRLNINLINL